MAHAVDEDDCPICDGSGFVRAAPISILNNNGFGQGRVPIGRNNHRRALWKRAVLVPCWICHK